MTFTLGFTVGRLNLAFRALGFRFLFGCFGGFGAIRVQDLLD